MEAKAERAIAWFVRLFWSVPLTFYLFTASPTPGWVDAPLIAKTAFRMELSTWVNNHNLFTILGGLWLRVMPAGLDPHYALNLLCAVLGAFTVYVFFLIGWTLTQNLFATGLGACVLMVSHSLWWHSTMLEVYTLSTLLLGLVLLFVVRYDLDRRFRDLWLAILFFGLACSNHVQMALVGAGFVGLLTLTDARPALFRPKRLLALALAFLAGFQVCLWVFGFELFGYLRSTPQADPLVVLQVMLDRTTGGGFKRYMFPTGLSWQERAFWWVYYAGLLVYNLPPPWLIAVPVGLAAWFKEQRRRLSLVFFGLAFAVQIAWSANYFVWDMYAFALPVYVMSAVPLIMGLDWACRRSKGARIAIYALAPTVLLIPYLYRQTPSIVAQSPEALAFFSRIPQYRQAKAFWDPLPYFLDPNKRGYDRVERYARSLLQQLEPNPCFWGSEAGLLYPLQYYYRDVLGERVDVSYRLVFGILSDERKVSMLSKSMVRELEEGCEVYVSSLGAPERAVLNRAYARLKPEVSRRDIAAMSETEFLESFPTYRFGELVVDENNHVSVLRLERRVPHPPE